MKNVTLRLTRAGIIAALYVALIFPVISFASGEIQIRPSEALCVLCAFYPEGAVSMLVGCLFANLITGCAPLDIVFGSLISYAAGLCTYLTCRNLKNNKLKFFLSGIFTVLLNAFLLPVIWYFVYGELAHLYIICVVFLLISEALSVYTLGGLLYVFINKNKDKIGVLRPLEQ